MKVIIPSELSGDEQWRYNDEYVPLSEVEARDARIEKLEARNKKLKEALRPFARYIAACEADTDKDEAPIKDSDLWVSAFDPVAMSMVELTYGDLFRARAALSTKEDVK